MRRQSHRWAPTDSTPEPVEPPDNTPSFIPDPPDLPPLKTGTYQNPSPDGTVMSDPAIQELASKATVLHIKPSDVLLIGNIGDITEEAAQRFGLRQMREALNVKAVYFFQQDIDVTLLRHLEDQPRQHGTDWLQTSNEGDN